jgi:hypothetical protein
MKRPGYEIIKEKTMAKKETIFRKETWTGSLLRTC